MIAELHPDDPDLIEKLHAIAPADRETALKQILRDWQPDRLWSAVFEWLVISVRREKSPADVELAFLHGKATERLQWVVHRVPGAKTASSPTGVTPYDLATMGMDGVKGRQKGGSASKRRGWALTLQDHLQGARHDRQSAMEALRDGVTIDTLEIEYRMYIAGDHIYCDDVGRRTDDANVGQMTVRNFFERYFRSN